MNVITKNRFAQLLTNASLCLILAGCFGTGDGPEPIAGTKAPPPPEVPAGFCDPINFEDECPAVAIDNFAGGATSIIDNPDPSGLNTSDKVAQMQKFADQVFGGTTIDQPSGIDFSAGEAFTMKVWSRRSVPVLFKFEGLDKERSLSHSGSGSWEELCFDFSGDSSGPAVTGITIIFDLGVNGDAAGDPDNWTFYYDDITQVASCGGGGGGGTTTLPINFEADPASYDFGMDGGFGGGAADVIANPDQSGLNTTGQTARMQKFAGEVFGGSTLTLAGNVDFSAGEAFRMKVWSTRAVPVLFKFEGLNKERSVDHTGGSEWQELCFDFTADTGGPATSAITFIFDLGVNGDATNNPTDWTFYFDEIEQVASCGGGGGAASFPVGFEADPASYDFGMDGGFGGGASDVIANPDQSGINTSAQTARMQKFAGEVFGGSTLALDGNVDFSAGEVFTMKVWATRTVPVLFKFEGLNKERSVTHTGGSEWQELCFDFSSDTAGPASNAITFIFDLGTNGDATNNPGDWTFYYDDIQQVASCSGGGGGSTSAAVDFESPSTGAGFTWSVFENADNPALAVIANPDASGVNTSATVGEFTARVGGQPFAGTVTSDLPTFTLDSSNAIVKIMVWKPVISNVGIKFENAAGGSQGEILVANTVTNQWEELTFDFTPQIGAAESTDITGLVIFPDFNARSQDNVIYFDNVSFSAAGGGGSGGGGGGTAATSTDFEPGGTYVFNDFGGGVATLATNPETGGINPSANVAQFQKFAGETFGGSTLDLNGSVDFSAGEAYRVKVYATRSVEVLFKLEGLNQERIVTHGGTGWEELCFDFSGSTTGDPATAITFIFDNGTAGDAAGAPNDWTFYVDDIEQTASCGGGGSAVLPIDFEADPSSYVFRDGGGFGGGAASVIANPDTNGNSSAQVGQMQKFAGAVFGGATLDLGGSFDLPANSAFTMKVWASRAVPVLFKLEGGPVGEVSVNHPGTGWEELCFDFGSLSGNGTDGITLIFDLGVNGDAAGAPNDWTFYFDDIALVSTCPSGGGTTTSLLPVDFEGDPSSYVFRDGGGFGGGSATVVANPDTSGNSSAQVGQMQKFAGEVFGGATFDLGGSFDLVSGTAFTMKVRATRAVPVLFKLEGTPTPEISANHGGTGWEDLCFDFGTATSTGVSGITLIFDLGVNGDAAGAPDDWTFYFDDIALATSCPGGGGGGGTSSAAIDFESAGTGAGFTWSVFENADNPALQIIANPDASGINTSATVAQFTARVGGQPFAGTITNNLPTFTLDASNAIVKIMVWKPVISDVGIKFENGTQGSTGEIKVANTVTNQWEELTFDFSAVIGNVENTDITGFIVFPDFDARAQDNVVYFDNVSFGDGS